MQRKREPAFGVGVSGRSRPAGRRRSDRPGRPGRKEGPAGPAGSKGATGATGADGRRRSGVPRVPQADGCHRRDGAREKQALRARPARPGRRVPAGEWRSRPQGDTGATGAGRSCRREGRHRRDRCEGDTGAKGDWCRRPAGAKGDTGDTGATGPAGPAALPALRAQPALRGLPVRGSQRLDHYHRRRWYGLR